MPAMALAPRPQSAKVLLTTVLTLFGFPAAAQQLGTTFALADQQTAVAHVVPGQFLRVRLKDGSRTGGPLIQATPVAFTLGPSVAFGDEDSRLYLGTVDSMWVRVYSTRRGMVIGALVGAAAGMGIGAGAASVCPIDGYAQPCTQGAVTSMAAGVLVGGLAGAFLGSGRSHWQRLLPRYGTGTAAPTGTEAVLTVPDDSTAFDPRARALMRVSRDHLLRLTLGDRGDLGGYVVRAGARGATLDLVSGHPSDAPIPLQSLEGIWERGTAARTGSSIGLLAGSLAGLLIAAHSGTCERNKCTGVIFGEGVIGAVGGFLLGDRVGHWFPQWHRKY
ncbi:MAG TPA: hypothetical protein VEK77_07765 [Gemmatimonadales bacterium]|nr:hypothetical protein [Gemmatimonadales bacterium]